MSIEGFPLKINSVEKVVYLWRKGSDHSITRIGIEENDGEPLYNWDLCQVGATAAAINAIKFCKKRNPFNGSITRFTVEMFVDKYFTYIQCLEKKPMFAKENFFNAKRFYHECYKEIENQISEDILKKIYTMHYAGHSSDMVGIIPSLTFFQFLDKIKSEDYRGKEEFDEIRSELPEWVIELDMKSGVLCAIWLSAMFAPILVPLLSTCADMTNSFLFSLRYLFKFTILTANSKLNSATKFSLLIYISANEL